MNATKHLSDDATALWEHARHSIGRHVLGISRHLQSAMMTTLQQECGHAQLRLSFAPYVTLIGEQNFRPTALAERLGITRQACNQTIRQLDAAGYVSHVADPLDGRAKLLTLTDKGRHLRRDGVRIAGNFDKNFASIATEQLAVDATSALRALVQTFAPGPIPEQNTAVGYAGLAGLLPRLCDYVVKRLMALTQAKGHPQLKLSFGQVVPMIGPNGGRIQNIAAAQDVSKQAISVIAIELEELGYLQREQDPIDARQIVLRFSSLGLALMTDAAQSAMELEQEFTAVVGQKAFATLATALERIFNGLGLEADNFDQRETVDLQLLAQQLKQQLGSSRSKELAQLLSK